MKKWMTGIALIVIGRVISFGISAFIVERQLFMLKPSHEGILLGAIFAVPLILYGGFYLFRYYRCGAKGLRTRDVYKDEKWWMILAVAGDLAALVAIFEVYGFLGEALVHVGISFVVSTIFYVVACLVCRPF